MKFLVIALLFSSCTTLYLKTWDAMGYEKREVLAKNIEEMKEDQEDTRETFRDALQTLKMDHNIASTKLEDFYDDLKDHYEDADEEAKDLRDRVKRVDEIAEAMFEEWDSEISTMSSNSLKSKSRQKKRQTERKFATLQTKTKKVVSSLDKPLARLRDQTLYVKHNLNAQSLDIFQAENKDIAQDVEKLLASIDRSIKEADQFLKESQL